MADYQKAKLRPGFRAARSAYEKLYRARPESRLAKRERDRRYWRNNREKLIAYQHARYANNEEFKEAVRNQGRRYRREHRDECTARATAWARRNPEKRRAALIRYAKAHPEQVSHSRKRWESLNREKTLAKKYRRRARERDALGRHTAAQWRNLVKQFGARCLCCGLKRKLTEDHIRPIVKGGTDFISNIQPLCLSCNDIKGTKTTDYRDTPFTGKGHPVHAALAFSSPSDSIH